MPIVELKVDPQHTLYFEHHTVLAKSPSLGVGIMPMRGLMRRVLAGPPVPLTKAGDPGTMSLSRDGVGEVIAPDLPGEEVDVMEHRFLAASTNVKHAAVRAKGIKNLLGSGSGFFMDRFRGSGLLPIHGFGDAIEMELAPSDARDLDPYAWPYKDASVSMNTHMVLLTTGLLGGGGFIMSRLTGSGRPADQSLDPLAQMRPTQD